MLCVNYLLSPPFSSSPIAFYTLETLPTPLLLQATQAPSPLLICSNLKNLLTDAKTCFEELEAR